MIAAQAKRVTAARKIKRLVFQLTTATGAALVTSWAGAPFAETPEQQRGSGAGFGDRTTTVETPSVGTLIVDLFDAKTEKLIWRSSSSDTLSDNADTNIRNLDKGVNKMLQHFPPSFVEQALRGTR